MAPAVRPRRLKRNEQKLIELLSSLGTQYPEMLVLVEGKRDESVLRALGVTSRIVRLHTGRSIEETIDRVAETLGERGSVLILTDFDQEGIDLDQTVERHLERKHIRINRRLRLRIRALMANLRCIEELISIYRHADARPP